VSYRDQPLPTFGADRFPGYVGGIEVPANLVPGAPFTPSGGARRVLNGTFGRLAPAPRGPAPLPQTNYEGFDLHKGMGDAADDLYRSGMVRGSTPGMQSMIDEFLNYSQGKRMSADIAWRVDAQNEWQRKLGEEVVARAEDRWKKSSNFFDKTLNFVADNPWIGLVGVTPGVLAALAAVGAQAAGATKGPGPGGMSGLAGVREPEARDKILLTRQAKALFENSKLATFETAANFRGQIYGLESALNEYQSWPAGWPGDGFDSSDAIRTVIGQALANVKIAEGSTGGDWIPQTQKYEDVSTTREFVSNVASKEFLDDVRATPGNYLDWLKSKAPKLPTCGDLPGPLGWMCENPGKTLAGAIAAAVAVYAGPTIIKTGKSWTRAVRS